MHRVETDVSFIDSGYFDQWNGNGGTFTQRSIVKRNASEEIRRALVEVCKQEGTFAPELSLHIAEYMSPALARQLEGATDDTTAAAIYDRFSSEGKVLQRLEYPKNANPRTVTLFNRILVYANPLESEAREPIGARRLSYSRNVAERTLAPFRELESVFSTRIHSVKELLRKRVISQAVFNDSTLKERRLRFDDVIVAIESEIPDQAARTVIDKINRVAEEYNLTEMPYITRIG